MRLPKIGDRVKGRRVAYDEWVTVEGIVTEVDQYQADGKPMANITVKTDEGYEDWFGADEDTEITPKPAPELPKKAVGWCHYCGQPAYSFGYFDEPACRECGG